jgi:YD repeat-containing protein
MVLEATTNPGEFYKSRISWNGRAFELATTTGSVYTFSNGGLLESIRDRFGNEIALFRTNGVLGEITRVQASSGRWLSFDIDPLSTRTRAVSDQSGRSVTYDYDGAGRLWKVHDATGGITEYGYDASGRLQTAKDPRLITWLTNHYDSNGRVDQQTLADGTSTYHFGYITDANGKVTQTDVTNPRGYVRRVTFNADGLPLTETLAFGTPRAQQTTFTYQPGTDLLQSQTDQRGRRTDYSYNGFGKVTQVTRLAGTPNAFSTTFTYEPVF